MKKLIATFLLVSSFFVSFSLYALPLGTSNILVSSDNMLFEYTPEGQIVQQLPIPFSSDGEARDLIVTSSGEVAIFNGTFNPELSIFNPQTEQWRSYIFTGWNTANNRSYGGIAAYGDGVYVTDMLADGNGIIRFGFDGVAQRYLEGNEYIDLTLGLDGKFYAIQAYSGNGSIDVIDPKAMQIIRTIQLQLPDDIRGVAVNANGDVYAASWAGELKKFDRNGLLINQLPGVFGDISDVDIDGQGRIIFQDRNNLVYLTNEDFIAAQKINLPVAPVALSFVAFSKNDALAPANSNVLVSSDNRMFEFSPEGLLIQETFIPSMDQARDLIVTKSGEIAFFNGTFTPELSLYDPKIGSWRSFSFNEWSTVNNISYGGIAAYEDYVYVTDMLTGGDVVGKGIVRFTISSLDGLPQRFMETREYIDLTVGLDKKLYALTAYAGEIDVIDPTTMQIIRSVSPQPSTGIRGIAVNKIGEIFTVNWNGELNKYDSNGQLLNSIPIAWNISDIDINASGKIILQDRNNNVFITDASGVNPVIFPLPVSASAMSFVAFAQNDVFSSTSFIDSDNDGLPDNWELQFALDPLDPSDALIDFEYDGLTNLQEFNAGTDPWNHDSDGDFLLDGDEVNLYGTDPSNRDTDSDGLPDGFEINNQLDPLDASDAFLDKDGDGLNNTQEYELGTSANNIDSDADGINDGDEVNQGLNPADRDTDDDGLADGDELSLGLNPVTRDSNNNDVIDGFEHGNIIRVNPPQSYSIAGTGPSSGTSLSADGRYVVFVSESSNIVSNDTNGVMDVFWTDTLTGKVRRISINDNGEEGNDWSGRVVNGFGIDISDDGRFVVFHSSASNLVANDTNNTTDIFVHDTQTTLTSLVSVNSDGIQSNRSSWYPSISGNGRYVTFDSGVTNWSMGADGSISIQDIFLHDRHTGVTTLVSKSTEGIEGNNHSSNAVISANGRYVAFNSRANNLVPNDTNGSASDYYGKDVFVHDLETSITQRVSISTNGVQGNHYSEAASISADGRYIAFHSLATTLDIDVPASYNVFVHDRNLAQTKRIVIDDFEGVAYNFRMFPSISHSGRYVALRASTSSGNAIFVYDQVTGESRLASRNNEGLEIKSTAGNDLVISDDGEYVAFSTSQWQLVPDKFNGVEDVFLAKTGFTTNNSAPVITVTANLQGYKIQTMSFDARATSDADGDNLKYTWHLGDGSIKSGPYILHNYATTGNYPISLYVSDGKMGVSYSAVVNIVNQVPVVSLQVPDVVYANSNVTMDASSSSDLDGDVLTYSWTFGDGGGATGAIVNHEYYSPGTYTITLSVSDGESSSVASKAITVKNTAPIPIISSTDSTYIDTVEVFDASMSTDQNGDTLSYSWNFGDGITAEGVNASHSYATSGSYTVYLGVFDGEALSTTSKTVNVLAGAPSAVITSDDSVNKNGSIEFDASLSIDPNGQQLSYSWDFGDGNSSSGIKVSHVYTASGSYTVILKVLDGSNPATIESKTISVLNQAPTPVINSLDSVDKNVSMSFDASSSSDPNGDTLTYSWDFGDGGTATGAIVNHTYTTTGMGLAAVVLTVSDGESSSSISKNITIINHAPTPVITSPDTLDKNISSVFNASSSIDVDGDSLTYHWNFGDGGLTSTNPVVNRIYSTSGSYTVTLTVSDGATSTSISKIINVVNQAPVPKLTAASSVNKKANVNFDASLSTDYNSDVLSYSWSFGDGAIATGAKISHIYTDSGSYTVTLTVSDGESSRAVNHTITVVNQAPIAVISGPNSVNKNVSSIFNADLSTDSNNDVLSYYWSFGDGVTATGLNVNHAYAISGNYTVTLTVSDGEISAITSKVVTVINQSPIANAGSDQTVVQRDIVTLDGSSSLEPDVGDSIVSYKWTQTSGRDVTLSSTNSAKVSFRAPRIRRYTKYLEFELTVTDEEGVTSSDIVLITVKKKE